MLYRQAMSLFVQQSSELQLTAGITGCDYLCAGRNNVRNFALAQLMPRFRLKQVVDAGRAAAQRRLGKLQQLDPRNSAQRGARRFAKSLCSRLAWLRSDLNHGPEARI